MSCLHTITVTGRLRLGMYYKNAHSIACIHGAPSTNNFIINTSSNVESQSVGFSSVAQAGCEL